jgi:hypothetical protein
LLFGVVCVLLAAGGVPAQVDPPGWMSHDISTSTVMAFAVWPADIDADGDLDVFSTGFNDSIAWHENVDGAGGIWVEHFISPASFAFSAFAVDLNGDAAVDVVVGSSSVTEPLVWFENRFGDGTGWIRRVIEPGAFNARDVHATDIDGDGDMDVLAALESSDIVVLSKNLDGKGTSWSTSTVGSGLVPISVDAGDMDADGAVDVLAVYSAETRVAWYGNTAGDGSSWVEHDILMVAGPGGHSVYPADMDGDGDLDAMAASFGHDLLAFNANTDGAGSAWLATPIATTIGNFISVQAADLDVDGDLDAVTCSFDSDLIEACPVAWQENLVGDGSSWSEACISTTPAKGRAAVVTDLDGDCDIDVVAATSTNDRVAWFENLWSGPDCNGNGIADACDIASGASIDCNHNGIPDECDLVLDPALDGLSFGLGGIASKPWISGANGVPDACEFPVLRALLTQVPVDPGASVRRSGQAAGGWSEARGIRGEHLDLELEGGAGAREALVYATFSGTTASRQAGPQRTAGSPGRMDLTEIDVDRFVAATHVVLDDAGQARALLGRRSLEEGLPIGAAGVLTIRAVLLDDVGQALATTAPWDLWWDDPRAAHEGSSAAARR